jgi:hypothetical protein
MLTYAHITHTFVKLRSIGYASVSRARKKKHTHTHLREAEEHGVRERVARSAEELQRESLIAHRANTQLRTKLL